MKLRSQSWSLRCWRWNCRSVGAQNIPVGIILEVTCHPVEVGAVEFLLTFVHNEDATEVSTAGLAFFLAPLADIPTSIIISSILSLTRLHSSRSILEANSVRKVELELTVGCGHHIYLFLPWKHVSHPGLPFWLGPQVDPTRAFYSYKRWTRSWSSDSYFLANENGSFWGLWEKQTAARP